MNEQFTAWVETKLAGSKYTPATVHTATAGNHADLAGWALASGFAAAHRALTVVDRRAALAADGIGGLR